MEVFAVGMAVVAIVVGVVGVVVAVVVEAVAAIVVVAVDIEVDSLEEAYLQWEESFAVGDGIVVVQVGLACYRNILVAVVEVGIEVGNQAGCYKQDGRTVDQGMESVVVERKVVDKVVGKGQRLEQLKHHKYRKVMEAVFVAVAVAVGMLEVLVEEQE